jgi:hypothetical protein
VRNIDASLLSAKHTVIVQNWDKGTRLGSLHIKGSMAQLFRGPVGTGDGTTGYLKDYNYDERLTYTTPPKFLMPISTVFGITQMEGSAAAYGPSGAPLSW